MMNVQVRSVGWDEIKDFSEKWVGQQVRLRRKGTTHTIVKAQMLMGEDFLLDNGDWVKEWDFERIS